MPRNMISVNGSAPFKSMKVRRPVLRQTVCCSDPEPIQRYDGLVMKADMPMRKPGPNPRLIMTIIP